MARELLPVVEVIERSPRGDVSYYRLDLAELRGMDIQLFFGEEYRGTLGFANSPSAVGVQLYGPEGALKGSLWTSRDASRRRTAKTAKK